jgi:hypothetical protein
MSPIKTFHQFLNEDWVDDSLTVQESDPNGVLTKEQHDFLLEAVSGEWKVNEKGLVDINGYIDLSGGRSYSHRSAMKKLPVKFGVVTGRFSLSGAYELESLEGSPYEVGGDFGIVNCRKITSLEGGPKKVGGDYTCTGCDSLTNLKGAPEVVPGYFSCSECKSLTSLEGAPRKVAFYFTCAFCRKLQSLKGAPEEVGGAFRMYNCLNLNSIEGLPKKIESNSQAKKAETQVMASDCPKLPKGISEFLGDRDLFQRWQDSDLSIEEFLHKKRGTLKGKEFGF